MMLARIADGPFVAEIFRVGLRTTPETGCIQYVAVSAAQALMRANTSLNGYILAAAAAELPAPAPRKVPRRYEFGNGCTTSTTPFEPNAHVAFVGQVPVN